MWLKAALVTLAVLLGLTGSRAIAGQAAAPAVSAKDAGARYGQALGVLEVCFGSKLTDKAKTLEGSFTGADLKDFKEQAAKVYEAWVKVRGCTNQKDPNTCKIIMDRSCQAAQAEIGENGTAYAGLVEFAKH